MSARGGSGCAGLVSIVAAAMLAGCITPPIVQPAPARAIPLATFPPGTTPVELAVGDEGAVLRGVFVPAGPGAPVVLHLLETATTIGFGGLFSDQAEVGQGLPAVWDLRGLGLSSLVLDYRGVGASSGTRANAHLRADAAAAFAAAVRRAGGRPDRVVVRANSLGTLAAATLLEAGVAPGAVVLVAPIRAETIGGNFLRFALWDAFAVPLGWLVGPALNVSLDRAVARGQAPLLVVVPWHDGDGFLPEDEAKDLARAVAQGGGRWARTGMGHNSVAKGACSLRDAERRFYLELFGSEAHAAERAAALGARLPDTAAAHGPRGRALLEMLSHYVWLEDPHLADALAGCRVPHSLLVAWTPWLERNRGARPLPDDGWQRILDLGDVVPEGLALAIVDSAIVLSGAPALRTPDALTRILDDVLRAEDPARFVADIDRAGRKIAALLSATCCRFLDEADDLDLPQRVALLTRALLKAAVIPDRLRDDGGRRVLEAWGQGGWQAVRVPELQRPTWRLTGKDRLPRIMDVDWPGASIPVSASMALLRTQLPDWLRQRLDSEPEAAGLVQAWVQERFGLLDWPRASAFLALGSLSLAQDLHAYQVLEIAPAVESALERMPAPAGVPTGAR